MTVIHQQLALILRVLLTVLATKDTSAMGECAMVRSSCKSVILFARRSQHGYY